MFFSLSLSLSLSSKKIKKIKPKLLTDGQRLADKLLLDLHGLGDDLDQPLLGELVLQQRVQEASKVAVEPFVAADELVGESQPGHEATLLEPEDGAEGTGEEDTLRRGLLFLFVCVFRG